MRARVHYVHTLAAALCPRLCGDICRYVCANSAGLHCHLQESSSRSHLHDVRHLHIAMDMVLIKDCLVRRVQDVQVPRSCSLSPLSDDRGPLERIHMVSTCVSCLRQR
jgi:hypothetical protein